MKLLFLTRHQNKGASSRYRSIQFFPFFEAAGHKVVHRPLFTDAYLDRRAAGGSPVGAVLKRYANRALYLRTDLAQADAVIIEKELFPYLPAVTELMARRKGIPIIYDYDDATWHSYERKKPFGAVFRNKIARVVGGADYVVAGSRYLKDHLSRWTQAPINFLPTSVSATRYRGQGLSTTKTVEIVWIGSMSTGRYLLPLFPMFERLHADTGARLRAIGFSTSLLEGPVPQWFEPEAWSPGTEIDLMASAHVGIMPIPDTPFERGKCGFKLVQYMGLGLPTVASPVGENQTIVQDGVTGRLADSPEEWYTALKELLENSLESEQMGARGREVFLSGYSTEEVAQKWINLVESLTDRGSK